MDLYPDNSLIAVCALLRNLKVKYSKAYVRKSLFSHPNYPSLLCIADVLRSYDIEILVIKIDESKIHEVSLPCIIHSIQNGSFFYVVTDFKSSTIKYVDQNGSTVERLKSEVLENWTGVTLLARKTSKTKEPSDSKGRDYKVLKFLAFSLLFIFVLFVIAQMPKIFFNTYLSKPLTLIYTFLKLTGIFLAALILLHKIDRYNPILEKICVQSKLTHCDKILNSKISFYNLDLNFGLLAFAYYFSTLCSLLILGFSAEAFSILGYLSFAASPVVLFSIYYQGFIAKKWCPICLALSLILVTELWIVNVGNFLLNPVDWIGLLVITFLFLSVCILWYGMEEYFEMTKKFYSSKRNLKRILFDKTIFKYLVKKSYKLQVVPDDMGVYIANSRALHEVIFVNDPFCKPCREAYLVLNKLVRSGRINLRILFDIAQTANDVKYEVIGILLTLYENKHRDLLDILEEWYSSGYKNPADFLKKHNSQKRTLNQIENIQLMSKWCDKEKIFYTPAFFIDGYELPREYAISDFNALLNI